MDSRVGIDVFEDASKPNDREQELLIFGYSCKLFRDDEKALYIDNEKHLIPWMGNQDSMIDRFDVRGTLYDLSGAESKGQTSLSEAEMKMEEYCDQERYFALYYDETHFQMMQEEELKRLKADISNGDGRYNQIGFSYADSSHSNSSLNDITNSKESSEPATDNSPEVEEKFFPTTEMNIPPEMIVPSTMKQHTIIVKTARFIASHGAQMEILIKTKQAGNSLFNFLCFDNALNIYYKHIISLVKSGKLKPVEELNSADQQDQHPQLNLPSISVHDLTPVVSTLVSQPSSNCPYSKLTSKIKESQRVPTSEESETQTNADSLKTQSDTSNTTAANQRRATKPGSVHSRGNSSALSGLVDYSSFNQATYTDDEDSADHHSSSPQSEKVQTPVIRDYSSVPWPPPEMQMVIDKMASYIIKNGHEFAEVVKSRKDPRMQFLESSHMYNEYFNCKMKLYSEVYGDLFKNPSKLQDWIKKCESGAGRNKTNGVKGISFSIKSREQEAAVTSRTSFPIESSTSEEDENLDEEEKERKRVAREKRREERKQKQEKEKKEREEFLRKERLRKEKHRELRLRSTEGKTNSASPSDQSSSENEDLYDIFKYAQEMDGDENKQKKVVQDTKEKKNKKVMKNVTSHPKEENANPVFPIGPQLPPDMALELSLNYPSSSSSPTRESEQNSVHSEPSSPSNTGDVLDEMNGVEKEKEEISANGEDDSKSEDKNLFTSLGVDDTVPIVLSEVNCIPTLRWFRSKIGTASVVLVFMYDSIHPLIN